MARGRKLAWTWRDYERQHGPRPAKRPDAPAADMLPDGAYLRPDGTVMVAIGPHAAVAEAVTSQLGLLRWRAHSHALAS